MNFGNQDLAEEYQDQLAGPLRLSFSEIPVILEKIKA